LYRQAIIHRRLDLLAEDDEPTAEELAWR